MACSPIHFSISSEDVMAKKTSPKEDLMLQLCLIAFNTLTSFKKKELAEVNNMYNCQSMGYST